MQYGIKMSRMYAPPLGICRPQGLLLRAADLLRNSREHYEVAMCFYEWLQICSEILWSAV
ncbi:uncharacterized protein LACBIDRAFT_304131 [Laccaria bicolor S238N-H82]|uniref:Predicted protein n=1 Tax=Laccaria bicolor (strain S238N-H82 / ATCC MYA-4686) TaxID=486041 RepID=B0CNS8_LACBS|nr:uncharacterized protein LACBIDRAFT_301546 [Laccaria bicolor S238N-H82]XP_001884564.1 uncharacterized protein LACBIDRAFT_304131 [Laccaria bicolor S238N-H82]EDR04740.1 predicted protein [Laccaria bicolor S238N-H82]EDR15990.1 predicted protein [Laccaria bicolor S238N-H82]|eukprot:XP_001874198.1 predicted protein [Laccaria bicolor S238N-H82]